MSISISNYPVHLQDGFKHNRECLKSQGSQSEYQKVFHRDSLEVSQLSKNREILMDKIKHTVVQSAASICRTSMTNIFSLKRKAVSVIKNTGRRSGNKLMRILKKGSSKTNPKDLIG